MIYMPDGAWGGLLAAGIIGGLIVGFLVARWLIKRELAKNPPINENMIRAMYKSMGRKPSEADIRRVMVEMKRQQSR